MTVRRGDIRTQARPRRRHALRHRRLLHQRRALPVPRRAERGAWRCRSTAASSARRRSTSRRRGAALRRRAASRRSSPASTRPTSPSTASSARRATSHVDPAYEYAEGLGYDADRRRQDAAQDASASAISSRPSSCTSPTASCSNREPEPSGEEGLQDVRIVQALYESAETGKAVAIPPFGEGPPADRAAAHHPARRAEARAGQGAERERGLSGSTDPPRRQE